LGERERLNRRFSNMREGSVVGIMIKISQQRKGVVDEKRTRGKERGQVRHPLLLGKGVWTITIEKNRGGTRTASENGGQVGEKRRVLRSLYTFGTP